HLFFSDASMELLAQFVKDAFFLLVVMRIAVIAVLIVVIVNAMKTPLLVEMFKRFRVLSKKDSYPGKRSTAEHR
ncbi:MAG TPA: hypothetical protein VEB86_18200, partial [Chryseosolibacter sp.]|nr:hypothetical protein [Chryseosolibacter sp.]